MQRVEIVELSWFPLLWEPRVTMKDGTFRGTDRPGWCEYLRGRTELAIYL
jgi:hypothetical protein